MAENAPEKNLDYALVRPTHTLVSYGGIPRGNIRVATASISFSPANTNGSSAQIAAIRSVLNRLEGLVRDNRGTRHPANLDRHTFLTSPSIRLDRALRPIWG